ncbi:MAG: macro domain-containing protein [Deltaproteobacteria bacterium]|jgi:O-acetyl-ADP-ribose deacetylase (regulator of RNase III)|nr:macro domain-containing protein [Deltaproteobacteria bacterium]MBW2532911.1 macro domain-containing protein [Deltaproteobacteria bacterium]
MAELKTSKKVKQSVIRVAKDDISMMDVDAFVFYADNDLKLGSGYGGAIAVRGGPKIQEELDGLGPQKTCAAVVSGGGRLKAKHIIHAVGPKFQEEDTEKKLAKTVKNALAEAEKLDIKKVALPPMGAGFYGVELDVSARITLAAIKKHLEGKSKLEEVMVIVGDKREYGPFSAELESLN